MTPAPAAIHAPAIAPVDLRKLALDFALVESADREHPLGNDEAVGPDHEFGCTQWLPRTWKSFTRLPPYMATDRKICLRETERYLREKLVPGLVSQKLAVTPYRLYLGWLRGLHGLISDSDMAKARRLENLYNSP
jgi:hypothetical protein